MPSTASEPGAGERPGYLIQHEPSMRLALGEAKRPAPGTDVPVGAVVLGPDGEMIGRGHNECLEATDPTAHAEIVAIRQAAHALASWRLDGCTLVVTLEPCTMCAGAVHAARIRRIVYGAADPRAGAVGSLWDLLRDRRLGPPVEVISGVLADECGKLLTDFFERLRSRGGGEG